MNEDFLDCCARFAPLDRLAVGDLAQPDVVFLIELPRRRIDIGNQRSS